MLRKEIELYNKDFLNIPYQIVINKIDLPDSKEKIKKAKLGSAIKVHPISVKTGEGMDSLKELFKEKIESQNAKL